MNDKYTEHLTNDNIYLILMIIIPIINRILYYYRKNTII